MNQVRFNRQEYCVSPSHNISVMNCKRLSQSMFSTTGPKYSSRRYNQSRTTKFNKIVSERDKYPSRIAVNCTPLSVWIVKPLGSHLTAQPNDATQRIQNFDHHLELQSLMLTVSYISQSSWAVTLIETVIFLTSKQPLYESNIMNYQPRILYKIIPWQHLS